MKNHFSLIKLIKDRQLNYLLLTIFLLFQFVFNYNVVTVWAGSTIFTTNNIDQRRWENNIIPYEINPSLSEPDRVLQAIQHWEERTQLQFRSKNSSDNEYIEFIPTTGEENSYSVSIGRWGGRVEIGLATECEYDDKLFGWLPFYQPNFPFSCKIPTVIHEIGHAVGLHHEQKRIDRDLFVTINWNNIESGKDHNFYLATEGTDVEEYDYKSIMHYGAFAFSIFDDYGDYNPDHRTIVPVIETNLGDEGHLTGKDISTIRRIYPMDLQNMNISIGGKYGRRHIFDLNVAGNGTSFVVEGNGTDGGFVILQDNRKIELNPGFEAKEGSYFTACVDNCQNLDRSTSTYVDYLYWDGSCFDHCNSKGKNVIGVGVYQGCIDYERGYDLKPHIVSTSLCDDITIDEADMQTDVDSCASSGIEADRGCPIEGYYRLRDLKKCETLDRSQGTCNNDKGNYWAVAMSCRCSI